MQHQVYEQRTNNTDPREQWNEEIYAHHGDYRSRKSSRLLRNLILALIILAAIAGASTFWGIMAPRTIATLPEHTFNVTGRSELIVNNGSGNVHIHAGSINSIVVRGTKYVSGPGSDVNAIDVTYKQQGNTVSVTGEEGWGIAGSRGIDLDITVPNALDVKVANGSGRIAVEDVRGNIEATTMSGGINVENVNGTMTLSTLSGGIDAQQVQLHGSSHIKTGSGSITFAGSLDPQGGYRMETSSGGIHLTLPSDASFRLDASTISGHITNSFEGTIVGNAPQPSLSVHTGSGGISIDKQ